MRVQILCLLTASTFCWAELAFAADTAPFGLRGVTAGATTAAELAKNERWGQQQGKQDQPDGSQWLEYRFWAWKKVTAVVRAGVVQTIDAIPPDRLPAQKLTDGLKLGELIAVPPERLPSNALVGTPANSKWSIFRCADAPGVLIFAEAKDGKPYARLLRMYSLAPPPRAYLGMEITTVSPEEFARTGVDPAAVTAFGLNSTRALHVRSVSPLSPAEKAGVKEGDVVFKFAGEKVARPSELIAVTHKQPVGSKRILLIARDGKLAEIEVLLEARPSHLMFFHQAEALRRRGQFQKAVPLFSKAIAEQPQASVYYQHRAICYRWLGRYAEALKDSNDALRLEPNSTRGLLERALCHESLGRLDSALADCDRILKLDPTIAIAHAVRGAILGAKQEYPLAFAAFEKAIQLNPKLSETYGRRGELFQRTKRYDEAIVDFSKLIELGEDRFGGLINRGYCYAESKEHAKAEADFRKAIEEFPLHEFVYHAHYRLGLALASQEKFETALAALDQSIRLNPRIASAYQARAWVHRKLGHEKQAKLDQAKYEELSGGSRTPGDSAQGAGKMVFVDTFNNKSTVRGRPLFGTQVMDFQTGGGRGVISSEVRGVLPLMYPKHSLRDFVAEFEAAHPNGNCQYGLVYRSDDMDGGLDHYYMLTITPQERIQLACWRSPRWESQQELPLPAGILQKRAPNRVRVEVKGKLCRVHMNGKLIGEFNDAKLAGPGLVGLCLSILGEEAASVVFYNLRVYELLEAANTR